MKPDFEKIKATTDLVRVVESYGVTLKKVGNDHVGRCPFHDDQDKPNLHVTAAKGLWRCPACGAAGNVIQFVAKKEGITDREAALKLCSAIPGVQRASALAAAPAQAPGADLLAHAELFAAIVTHYHECLLSRGKRGLEYLQRRGLGDVEMLAHFRVGYCDGGLKKKLSAAQIKAAQACGLFNEKGNEKFYGRVVVPIFDDQARPVGLYGRDISGQSEVAHIYLAGEHRAVWNSAAAAAHPDELIVTEAIFDALAIFAAGKRNVIAAYGAGGWTPHHDALIERAEVRKLVLAFDADDAGERAARELAAALAARGVRVHRVRWPAGVKDANDYFLYHEATGFKGTAESFAQLLAAAPRLGFVRAAPADAPGASAPAEAAKGASGGWRMGEPLALVERSEEHALFANGSVSYRVKGLGGGSALKVVITAASATEKHVDHLDLYGARARKGFAAAAAARLGAEEQKIEGDLLALVETLEQLRAENGAPAAPAQPPMSEAERAEALALLRAPDLLDRIAADLELAGYVGEARNKQLAYLIATSRRLPKPLSCIFRAQSGSGKSFLMECVAELMPPEDVHYFSRLTPQALYYLEPDALTHRLLIVDERDGSEESEYPIRTLQTRRVLTLAVPLKDPNSGKIKTTVLEIHGPIAYMESTTDQRINPENANRCFELYLDETEAQTRAIFAAQRRARSLDGWRHERRKTAVARVHHNAQRLLRSLKVIIPFVEQIDFPLAWLRGRRDHDRFLSLIEGLAFLHQHQRTIGHDGGAEYIEASLADYALAYDLAHQVFADGASDLPKPARDFLAQVERVVESAAKQAKATVAEYWFTRRQVREALRLPDHLAKRHMREIEELEYVQVQRAPSGGSFRYRLLPDKKTPAVLDGLLAPAALAAKAGQAGQKRKSA
jgi:DNA primase catalytic core